MSTMISVDMEQAVTVPDMFTPEVLREVFPQGVMPSPAVPSRLVRTALVLAYANTVLVVASVIALAVK